MNPLTIIFWVQVDRTKCSAVNGANNTRLTTSFPWLQVLKFYNSLNINRIWCYLISIDSSFNSLQNIFWVQLDVMKCSSANSRNNTRYRSESSPPAFIFRDSPTHHSVQSPRSQKIKCRAHQTLQTVTCFISKDTKLGEIFDYFIEFIQIDKEKVEGRWTFQIWTFWLIAPKKVSFFFFKNKTNEQLQKWVLMKGGG